MNQDLTFRTVLIVACAAILPLVLYYRLKSQSTGEKLDRRQEGLFMLMTLRPVGLAYWVGLIAYMVDPSSMAWSSVPLAPSLRWSGAGVFALSFGLLAWTLRNLGGNLTDTVVTRRTHSLVTSGPYRWVRHPFYDAVLLLILATTLLTANWFLLLTGAIVVGLLIVRLRAEEQNLLARFGDPYRLYRERTGAFLPRIVF